MQIFVHKLHRRLATERDRRGIVAHDQESTEFRVRFFLFFFDFCTGMGYNREKPDMEAFLWI